MKIHMLDIPFRVGDVIYTSNANLIVTKVYRMTWWKKLLDRLNITKGWFIGIEVDTAHFYDQEFRNR